MKKKIGITRVAFALMSASSFLVICSALASGSDQAAFDFMPITPGASLTGQFGNGGSGYGESLLPIYGNNKIFGFTDIQGQVHNDDDFAASGGIGGRWLGNEDTGILGAYVFGDYNHAPDGHAFWFVNPGIERLGDTLDFSANFYAPVSSQRENSGVMWADQAGDTSQMVAHDHQIDDVMAQVFYSVGYGGDAQIGYRLPINFESAPEIFLGGYYFKPQDETEIRGGAVRLEFPINSRMQLLVSEAYDNVAHNTIKAGVTFNLGSRYSNFDSLHRSLESRMTDPIRRHVSSFSGSTLGTNEPIVKGVDEDSILQAEITNISFFTSATGATSTAGVVGDGTAENPYVDLTSANTTDGFNQGNNKFFLSPGQYDTTGITFASDNGGLYGRTDDYLQAASSNNRPIITMNGDSITVTGDNTTIDALNFNNNNLLLDDSTLKILGPNTFISNININNNNTSFRGIDIRDNELTIPGSASNVNVTIKNTNITGAGDGVFIIQKNGVGNINLNIDNLNSSGNLGNGIFITTDGAANTAGVLNFTGNNMILNNNVLNGFVLGNGRSGTIRNVDIANTQMNDNQQSGYGSGSDEGVDNVIIRDSQINNNVGDGMFLGYAAAPTAQGNFTLINTTITGNGGSGIQAFGTAGATNLFVDIYYSTIESSTTAIYAQQGALINVYNPLFFSGNVQVGGSPSTIEVNFINFGTTTVTVPSSTTKLVTCDGLGTACTSS